MDRGTYFGRIRRAQILGAAAGIVLSVLTILSLYFLHIL